MAQCVVDGRRVVRHAQLSLEKTAGLTLFFCLPNVRVLLVVSARHHHIVDGDGSRLFVPAECELVLIGGRRDEPSILPHLLVVLLFEVPTRVGGGKERVRRWYEE